MIRSRYLAGLLVAATLTAAALTADTASAQPARDRPPECNLVKLYAPSGRVAWVDFCGGAGGQESPVQDWAAVGGGHGPLTMDGVRTLSPYHCPKAQPCVVLAENAPQS